MSKEQINHFISWLAEKDIYLCVERSLEPYEPYSILGREKEEEILEKYFKECEEVEKKESEKLLKIIEVLKKDEV
jgi:hypothetical protein